MGKSGNKNVFVPFAIPGERLEIEIVRRFSDYDEGKIVRVLESSPKRILPACPLYMKCGGCDYMHIDYEFQSELKAQVLKELFLRAGLEVPEIQKVQGPYLAYRSRFQLHDGGMEGRGSNEIVPIAACPVAVPEINEWLSQCPMEERPKGKGLLFGHKNALPKLSFALEEKKPQNPAPKKPAFKGKKKGKKLPPSRFEGIRQDELCPVQAEICGKKIVFDAKGFFQSNLALLEKTVPLIAQGLAGKNALDLYSGAGTFSVFLADSFERVAMVEQNRLSMVCAERNMAGKAHESFGISGADFAKRNAQALCQRIGPFDAAVVDPPRSGVEREALEWLSKSGIPVIKYLSCNPSTQVRDLKKLKEKGYKIEKICLLDFYPQTSHMETLATCVLE